MDDREARLRLGVGEDASEEDVLSAYHRCAADGAALPANQRRTFMRQLDAARDALLGHKAPIWPSVLDQLATPRGMAALTSGGVAFAALAFLSTATIGLLSVVAPVVFAFAATVSISRRRILVGALLALAFVGSGGVVVRRLSNPGTTQFFYGGEQLGTTSTKSPFFGESAIPLTLNPAIGTADETVIADPSASTIFVVSCVAAGRFGKRRGRVDWAYVTSGTYETYWVPVAYLAGLDPGEARSLLPCSDWRWELQNLGTQ